MESVYGSNLRCKNWKKMQTFPLLFAFKETIHMENLGDTVYTIL